LSSVELKRDSTSNIARRYGYLFRLPSTGFALLYASLPLIGVELVARSFTGESLLRIVLYAVASEIVLVIGIEIDLFFLRSRKGLATFRRLATVSIISNLLWFAVSVVGLILYLVTKNEGRLVSLVLLGAFFAVCFRAIVFGSVFYKDPFWGLPLALIQPILLAIPATISEKAVSTYSMDTEVAVVGGIIAIFGIEVYLRLIDRPVNGLKALRLLQAFLQAWTVGKPDDLEHYFQISSETRQVTTEIIRLQSIGSDRTPAAVLILPGIHPGPFSPVGSSNLPGDIYQKVRTEDSIPLIFHSISDHELNLPSKEEVQRYADSLENHEVIDGGKTISVPFIVSEGKATATGIALGKTVMITLTLAPYGMEDLPGMVRTKLEETAAASGFKSCLVIDSHNSLGEKPDELETQNLIKASSKIIKQLSDGKQLTFNFGFAHSSELPAKRNLADVGPAGFGLLYFVVENDRFCYAVVDANNSTLGFREKIMEIFHHGTGENLLEICTSDTHVTAAKAHNAKGYLALGDVTTPDDFSALLVALLEKAKSRLSQGTYETSIASSSVRTIGSRVLDNFSGLLDESALIAKRGAQVLGMLAVVITLAVALL